MPKIVRLELLDNAQFDFLPTFENIVGTTAITDVLVEAYAQYKAERLTRNDYLGLVATGFMNLVPQNELGNHGLQEKITLLFCSEPSLTIPELEVN